MSADGETLTAAEQVARFAVGVRERGLPKPLRQKAAAHLRDTLGVLIAAVSEWPENPVSTVVERWGGCAESTALGRGARLPAAGAALLGGTFAHSLDFDDSHLPSVLHPSSTVVPAALAVAETVGASGLHLLEAIAVGDEVCCRLGMAGYDLEARNSIFFEAGLHATAICGAVGAAAACALLAGGGEQAVMHAMAIASSFSAGLLEANRTGGMVKRAHCGWAAHAGVAASELAGAGLTGPATVFEGRFGFLYAYCREQARPAAITDGLGDRWELDRLHVKPYPANHFTHAIIDAALALARRGVRAADVAGVEVRLAAPVLRTVAEPAAAKAAPPTGYNARFSAPFTFAAALRGGGGLGVFLDDFTDERVRDEELLELAAKVRCVADEQCNELFPSCFPAIVRVELHGGGSEQESVLVNRGGPGRPLSEAELATKFRICAERTLPAAQVEQLDACLRKVETLGSVARLAALSVPAG